MPRINGLNLPWSAIVTVVVAAMWMGGLSYQVNANGDKIQEQSETKERLVRIEERQNSLREDVAEIKKQQDEQSKKQDEQTETLNAILQKLSEE